MFLDFVLLVGQNKQFEDVCFGFLELVNLLFKSIVYCCFVRNTMKQMF